MKRQTVRGYGTKKPSVSLKDIMTVFGLCAACIGIIAATFYFTSAKNKTKNIKISSNDNTKIEENKILNDDIEESTNYFSIKDDEMNVDIADANSSVDVNKSESVSADAVNEDDIYGTSPVINVNADVLKLDAPLKGNVLKGQSNTELVYSKTLDDWRLHNGIDISANVGTTVCASSDGVIENVKNDIRFGHTIVISHGDNLKTVYSNLTGTKMVKNGMDIKKGDPIGMVGESAVCESLDEPHLHFEVILDGKYVNPLDYFSVE